MSEEKNPLPIGEGISIEEIDRRFTMTEVRPPANPGYAIRLLVPKGWVADHIDGMEREVNAVQLTPLAGWHAPHDGAPVIFHVQALGLLRDMTAAHFTISYGLKQELPLEVMREVNPYLADALFMKRIQGHPFCMRMATRFDGDRAFIATGVAHTDDYDAFEETFGVMIASLEIVERAESPYVERRVRRTLMDRLQFDAPASFRAMPADDGTDTHQALDLFHKDTNGFFTGMIRVEHDLEAVGRTEEQELGYVVAHLMSRGMELEAGHKDVDLESSEGPLAARKMVILRGKAPNDELVQEAWVTLLEARGAAVRVWMLGAARDSSFDHWAVNQRAYRILLETMRYVGP